MKRVLVVLALLAVAIAPAGAATNYQELLDEARALNDDIEQDLEDALEELADGDLATAKTKAQAARAKLVQLDNLIAQVKADGVMPSSLANIADVFTNRSIACVDSAIARLDNILSTKSQLVSSVVNAGFCAARANNYVQRSQRSSNSISLIAAGPSLHTAGKKVCWTVRGIPAGFAGADSATCPIEATFVNPFATSLGIKPIQDNPFIAPFDNPCMGRVCFLMGRDLGGGRIEIRNKTTDELLGRRLVFNYGSPFQSDGVTPRIYPSTGKPLATLSGVAQFAGTYTGGFSGTLTFNNTEECSAPSQPISGTAAGTVSASGRITVTAPGSGSGSVSPLGTYATGGVSVDGASSSFKGAIINSRINDSAVASGTWTSTFPCGKGAGTWSATRPGGPP